MNLEDIMLNAMSDTKGQILYGSTYMIGKFIQRESRIEVARGQEEGNGEFLFNGCRGSIWDDENVLKIDSVDGCKTIWRASLVAQWLRICLPMQGTRVRALVWEDPTCRGATGPMSHNF